MKTVACVVVRSARVFEWLGNMPAARWVTLQLKEVRGIDDVVVCVDEKLAAKAATALPGLTVVKLPRGLSDTAVDAWLHSPAGPAAAAEVVVRVRPTVPLLPAGKIEQCLDRVLTGRCSSCGPSRPTAVRSGDRTITLPEVVGAVRVFRTRTPDTAHQSVNVTLVESLDIEDPDEYTVVDALVSCDKV